MQQIVLDASLVKTLGELSQHAMLCDSSGQVIGLFSPVGKAANELRLQPRSIAETEELRKARTGKPLREILERLGIS